MVSAAPTIENYRVVMFDLDGTLAPSKSTIDPEMAAALRALLERVDVCIISGGRFEQFDTQVLAHLGDFPELDRLHLMPTNGTRYLRRGESGWEEVYFETLSDDEKTRALDVLRAGAQELGLWAEETWGPALEDRGSQVTYSALGQAAPVDAKLAWDPDNSKKEALRAYAAERLPDLEVRSGGSTSIDITKRGIDKAYGTRKLMSALNVDASDILFFGDRLDPGGNDRPVMTLGIECIAVEGWEDTVARVRALLGT